VRALVVLSVSLCSSLALAAPVAARSTASAANDARARAVVNLPWRGLSIGVDDDSAKIGSLLGWFYPTMRDDGLKLNVLTLRWDPRSPFSIPAKAAVRNAVTAAQTDGIAIELDLYPLRAHAFTDGRRCEPSTDPESCGDAKRLALFADWTAFVASAFPTVHQFVVMNECNQPLFLNPQWAGPGENQSAAICGRALAAAYDALKAENGRNFVWGIGLSPRGNDNAGAVSNSSTSPVRFLGYLGAWFKAFARKTHRTAPLMDGLDFHPYPVPQSLPFSTGYASPNDASVANLPRIYQAFYDAFADTRQRTIGPQRHGGLPVSLGETGIQTAPRGNGYDGREISANPAGGVLGQWATQTYQARWYLAMLRVVACDPNVRVLNIFHLLDETSLAGWQSGLYFANRTPKQSASTVRNWIATTDAGCGHLTARWKPGRTIALPSIDLSRLKLPKAPATSSALTSQVTKQTAPEGQPAAVPTAAAAPPAAPGTAIDPGAAAADPAASAAAAAPADPAPPDPGSAPPPAEPAPASDPPPSGGG
jgi:hypothetical protein